ncbi:MAG: Fic family protein [Ignavibacteriales bacterium]|nr:Fic family protein [Ignavibacteriales bacterium]
MDSELSYLEELIHDFPPPRAIHAAQAYKFIESRYLALEKQFDAIENILKSMPSEKFDSLFEDLIEEEDYLPLHLYTITGFLHNYLFSGILSNAGEFRHISDPYNGAVGFGGANKRVPGDFLFNGAPPSQIKQNLIEAFKILQSETTKPIATALEFYRRFVKVHPFYDANGRIARFIVSVYLRTFGKYIKWSGLEQQNVKNQFIKRLNECHKREGSELYQEYFAYLLKTFSRYVTDTSVLMGDL